jgi:hypothetical protein
VASQLEDCEACVRRVVHTSWGFEGSRTACCLEGLLEGDAAPPAPAPAPTPCARAWSFIVLLESGFRPEDLGSWYENNLFWDYDGSFPRNKAWFHGGCYG